MNTQPRMVSAMTMLDAELNDLRVTNNELRRTLAELEQENTALRVQLDHAEEAILHLQVKTNILEREVRNEHFN